MKISTLTFATLKRFAGKRILLRVDFNVPLTGTRVSDDTRIRETLPTIKLLLKHKARLIIMTHMGRPDGKIDEKYRLKPVALALQKILKKKVTYLKECIGPSVEKNIAKMKPGEVALLENLRFNDGEEANDAAFTKALAALGDIYVNDAFAVSHRAHASVYGITKLLPSFAGLLLEAEIKNLTPLITKAKRPLTLIVGGAKIDTKIGLIKNFFGKADTIIIGGALANTFLKAQGYDVGSSLYEKEKIGTAQEILLEAQKKKVQIVLPQDVIVADEITQTSKTLDLPIEDVMGAMKILDIGAKSRLSYTSIIKKSQTIIWNGPIGLYEFKPFAGGTNTLAKIVGASKAASYIGGGDTIDALKRSKVPLKKFTFISTGGGAMLEFLEGKKLPGIVALSSRAIH